MEFFSQLRRVVAAAGLVVSTSQHHRFFLERVLLPLEQLSPILRLSEKIVAGAGQISSQGFKPEAEDNFSYSRRFGSRPGFLPSIYLIDLAGCARSNVSLKAL
jgi:hypothetical protein